jgi:hypothetical protein
MEGSVTLQAALAKLVNDLAVSSELKNSNHQ